MTKTQISCIIRIEHINRITSIIRFIRTIQQLQKGVYTMAARPSIKKLTPDARKAQALYMREWRKNHPDKCAEYNRRKWEKKGEELRQKRELEQAANNELL